MFPAPTRLRLDDLTGLTPLVSTTTTPDPGPIYEALRGRWGPVAPVELDQDVPAWLVMDYPDVVRVIKDQLTFSRNVENWRAFWDGRVRPGSGLQAFFAPKQNAFYSDGEAHSRYRAAVDDAFDRVDGQLLARSVRQACDHMLNQICERGSAELVASYTGVVPSLAVSAMYGLELDDAGRMLQLAHDIFSGTERAAPAFEEINSTLAAMIEHRRATPGPDLLSSLVHHPAALTRSELVDTAQMIQSAGNEMATSWATGTLVHLLTDSRFAGRVSGGRLGVDEALNYTLIHNSPTWNTPARFATVDVEIAGRQIDRGDAVVTAVAEAAAAVHRGHDVDQIWSTTSQAHLAFGAGPHRCPAVRLSHIIIRTAVTRVLERLPGLRLTVPVDQLGHAPTLWSRYAPTLPIAFEPTRPHPLETAGQPRGIFHT